MYYQSESEDFSGSGMCGPHSKFSHYYGILVKACGGSGGGGEGGGGGGLWDVWMAGSPC